MGLPLFIIHILLVFVFVFRFKSKFVSYAFDNSVCWQLEYLASYLSFIIYWQLYLLSKFNFVFAFNFFFSFLISIEQLCLLAIGIPGVLFIIHNPIRTEHSTSLDCQTLFLLLCHTEMKVRPFCQTFHNDEGGGRGVISLLLRSLFTTAQLPLYERSQVCLAISLST